MFVRKLFYPLFNFISIRHIHKHPPACYLSQKSIRNYINKGSLDVWDIYNITCNEENRYNIKNNIYTIEHIWPKSFLKNNRRKHLLSDENILNNFHYFF